MATYIPLTNVATQFFDLDGEPLNGGSIEFYLAGTTTATDLYSDNAGTSIGTSIALNSLGYPESGGNAVHLFRDQSYAIKLVLKDSTGAVVGPTMDNIPAVASFDSTSSAKLDTIEEGATATDTANVTAAGALMTTGGTMSGNLTMAAGTFVLGSTAAGIAASSTQTQAAGFTISSSLNEVTTVAAENDAVTLPTAVAGYEITIINNGANTLQIFPAADDSIDAGAVDASTTLATGKSQIFRAKNSTVWESLLEVVTAVVSGSSEYASFYDEANAAAYVINAQTDIHAYHTATIADGGSGGWTFDAGGSGVSVPIASIADGTDTGVDIAVTTTGNHGLAVGDIVSHTNLASAVYTGIFMIKAVISNTVYEVEAVFTATDTGTMDAAATLTCDVGSGGNYVLDWSASASAASSSDVFDFTVYKNTTVLPGSSTRRKFGTGGDIGAMAGVTPPFAAVAGDKISFMLANTTSAGNTTNRNLSLRIVELV